MAGVQRRRSGKDGEESTDKELEIVPHRQLGEILEIDPHLLGQHLCNIALLEIVRLREQLVFILKLKARFSGNARREQQCRHHFIGILLDILRHLRPRADKAHLLEQNIYHLSELIKTGLAQKMPDLRYSRIALAHGELRAYLIGILHHCAEFEYAKRLTVPPDPHLTVKNRALGGTLDEHPDNQIQRQQHNKNYQCDNKVKNAFEKE